MRIALTILFYSFCQSLFAANYYVANVGSDSNSGDIGNPFATIAKANSVAISGDIVYLKRGDTWHEKVYPVSGVTYDAYGTGALPIITGFKTLTSWTNEGGNIWSTVFSDCPSYLKVVYLNGAIREKGRYPNNDYLTYTSHSGKNQITGSLTGTPSYVGAEAAVKSQVWQVDKKYITAQSGGTLTLSSDLTYEPVNNNGYIIFNTLSVLDVQNEWSIDTTTKKIYVYSTSEPTGKASSIDTLVNLKNKTNVLFKNIQVEGANLIGFFVDSSQNVTIDNCIIQYSGGDAIAGGYGQRNLTITNDSIYKCWNSGIFLNDFALSNDSLTISNNSIRDIGLSPIMLNNGNWGATGINIHGSLNEISYNKITNTGYSGIFANGKYNNVHHNLIDSFATVNTDGGGIYMNALSSPVQPGNRITKNIVLHGMGTAKGAASGFQRDAVYGIYLDDNSSGIIVDSNTIAYMAGVGINFHNTRNDTARNNLLVFNGLIAYYSLPNPYYANQAYVSLSANPANMYIAGNIYHSDSAQYLIDITTLPMPYTNVGFIDSNYYSNSKNDSHIFRDGAVYLSLANMKDSGLDIHSKVTPDSITTAKPILFYNTGLTDKVVSLDGGYTDMQGNLYNNYAVIKPFAGLLLFKSTKYTPQKTYKISTLISKLVQL